LPSLRSGLPLFAVVLVAAVVASAGVVYASSGWGRSAVAAPLLTGGISGTVTDQATGLPIVGVGVGLYTESGSSFFDFDFGVVSDGSYTISNLAPGSYRVRAGASGYASEFFNNTYDYNASTLVVVTEGATAGSINFALGPGGSISGTVMDQGTGLPISGVNVYAYYDAFCCGAFATTGATGAYIITSLGLGSYRVRAGAPGYLPNYAREYYDNTYDSNAATLVTVTEGATTSGTNFALALDTDDDGCADVQEAGFDPLFGGDRDPLDPWDFYDVDGTKSVTLSDTLLILEHFGHAHNTDALDPSLDRYVPDSLKPWRTAAATGGVNLQDALANLLSFGHSCAAPP